MIITDLSAASPPFRPKMIVVGGFVYYQDERSGEVHFLMLRRHPSKPQGNTWGIPSGKIEGQQEHPEEMTRELAEEAGVYILPERFDLLGMARVRFPEFDFEYHMFACPLSMPPSVRINPEEHTAHAWPTLEEAGKMPLIEDMWPCIERHFIPYLTLETAGA